MYTVSVYWPSNSAVDSKYSGSGFGITVNVSASALQAPAGSLPGYTDENFFKYEPGTITDYDNEGGYDVMIPLTLGGEEVITIGANAFQSKGLNSVIIPNRVITIGQKAFEFNRLTGVKIGEKVASIGNNSFEGNLLTNISIPANVRDINGSAFKDNNITRIKTGSGVRIKTKDSMGTYGDSFKALYDSKSGEAGTYYYNADQWMKFD